MNETVTTTPEIRNRGIKFFVYAFVFTVLLTGAGVFHVWYNYEIYTLGYRLAQETHQHRRLLDQTKKLRLELSTLKRSQSLTRIARDKLGLRPAEHRDWVIIK